MKKGARKVRVQKPSTGVTKIDRGRAVEAKIKASLIKSFVKEVERKDLTHQEVADLAGVSRTTITGIINGSLQKVTINRLLRIATAIGMGIDLKVKA